MTTPLHPTTPGRSWSGTVDYGPGRLFLPSSLDELQALVAGAGRIRALGTRHSFSTVAASDADLVSLERMPRTIDIDTAAGTARVGAGVRYGELVRTAWEAGLALSNMGSLPHISVAGAAATGTHGSGDANQVLAASVREVELVTADGSLLRLDREQHPEMFGGVVLSMGLLGVLTHLTFDLVPAFDVRQAVYLDLPPERMTNEDLQQVLGGAYSVSMFHHWDGHMAQVWAKQKVDAGAGGIGPAGSGTESEDGVGPAGSGTDSESTARGAFPSDRARALPESWHGARRATGAVHPLPRMPADFCTDQTGEAGPYFERLPHFRMEFTPSAGEEIQSEYFVAREHVADALRAVTPLGERIRPLLHASEVRTVAADDLWLSPASGRDSACVHFTWTTRQAEVEALLPEIEAALAPFAPRPHWGKVHTMDPSAIQAQYPRLEEFRRLRARLDPERVFTNDYTERMLGI